MAEELFTFVLVPEVEATNNGMERELATSGAGPQSGPDQQDREREHIGEA